MDNQPLAETPLADVAVNIFAKPYQTALTLLSLAHHSREHINSIWLQFEPFGSTFDKISPYHIADFLKQETDIPCKIFQPETWLARSPVAGDEAIPPSVRSTIRYQAAFEYSKANFLFITHNDVFFLKDLLGELLKNIGDCFAIGPLGQCQNCPAKNEEISRKVMNQGACSKADYELYKPTHQQLCSLYAEARARGVFIRPYDVNNFKGKFENQPWPLPECRINEWACLVNLDKTRNLTQPYGKGFPYGAFDDCAGHNLDIAVSWFRDMHAYGLKAKHFDVSKYIKHWVGTGNKSAARYAYSEDRAKRLLEKHFPRYISWLETQLAKQK